MLQFSSLEIYLKNSAHQIAQHIMLSEQETERYVKEALENYISSGELERQLKSQIGEAISKSIKYAFENWEVRRAMEQKIKEIFLTKETP